jgi:ligand-binding sensor domain-containing protein
MEYEAPTPVVRVHIDNQGNLWFVGLAGVFSWAFNSPSADPEVVAVYNSLNTRIEHEIQFLAFTPDDAIWFATYGGGIYRFDGKDWSRYTKEDGLGDDQIGPILVDNEGGLWVGSAGGGLSYFDGDEWATYTTDYSSDQGISGNFIYSIYQSEDGSIWFGTDYGITRFYQGNWSSYTAEEALPYQTVFAIASDEDGIIWIGNNYVEEGAILRFNGKNWEIISFSNEDANILVRSIAYAPDGSLWFATLDGILIEHNGSWMTISEIDGSRIQECYSIVVGELGNLWFACGESTLRYSSVEQ